MPSRTDWFRTGQDRLQDEAIRRMAQVWGLLDPQDIDGTLESWSAAAIDVAVTAHGKSVAQALQYYRALRKAKVDEVAALPSVRVPVDRPDLLRRLVANGPAVVKRAMAAGHGIERASLMGLTVSAQEIAAHTRDAGRATIMQSAIVDPHAEGWARVGSGSECGFCAMLISRGAVYSSDSANFAAHRSCQCDAEPVFNGQWDGKAAADSLADEWDQVTDGSTGKSAVDAWNAHRAAGNPPPEKLTVEPPKLTAAQVADKTATQVQWAESAGWSTQVDGRVITGSRPDGSSIKWELSDAGAWRVAAKS